MNADLTTIQERYDSQYEKDYAVRVRKPRKQERELERQLPKRGER
jgi:hypothetical protein